MLTKIHSLSWPASVRSSASDFVRERLQRKSEAGWGSGSHLQYFKHQPVGSWPLLLTSEPLNPQIVYFATENSLSEAYIIRDYAVPTALRVNTDQTQLGYQQGSGSTSTLHGSKQVATVEQEETV
ncbi:hypothetical protein C8R43DRAFT_956458 [Mycena crocata]|nr:hypothetical protein C8R43DRAFT_956458 [Mycena crocata]